MTKCCLPPIGEELKKLADLVKAPHDGLFEIALPGRLMQQNAERETVDPALMEKMMEALAKEGPVLRSIPATEGASLTQNSPNTFRPSSVPPEVEKLDPLCV